MQVSVEGLRTFYATRGKGLTIVLLHGWGTQKENLDEIADILSRTYKVISLDLPGFGESEHLPLDWDVLAYTRFVQRFLVTIDQTEVFAFIGHSFGGRLIIKGVSEGLLKSMKLVFIGSAGVGHSKNLRNTTYAVVAKVGKTIMKLPGLRSRYGAMRGKFYERIGSMDYARAGAMQQVFLNTIHEDLRDDIKHITVPTLLIWGSEDNEAPLADARYFHEHIKGSQLKILQGAGHFVHNEKPQKVAKFIEDFLA